MLLNAPLLNRAATGQPAQMEAPPLMAALHTQQPLFTTSLAGEDTSLLWGSDARYILSLVGSYLQHGKYRKRDNIRVACSYSTLILPPGNLLETC
jgi:hypothetical protein